MRRCECGAILILSLGLALAPVAAVPVLRAVGIAALLVAAEGEKDNEEAEPLQKNHVVDGSHAARRVREGRVGTMRLNNHLGFGQS